MSVPTPDFSVFTSMFQSTWILGTQWIIPLVITVIIMAVVTRDMDKWKLMAFPIFTLERIMGMRVNWALITLAGIVFVVEALSLEVIGRSMRAMVAKKEDIYQGRKEAVDNMRKAARYESELSSINTEQGLKMFGKGILGTKSKAFRQYKRIKGKDLAKDVDKDSDIYKKIRRMKTGGVMGIGGKLLFEEESYKNRFNKRREAMSKPNRIYMKDKKELERAQRGGIDSFNTYMLKQKAARQKRELERINQMKPKDKGKRYKDKFNLWYEEDKKKPWGA